MRIGFVGAHTMVLPEETLRAAPAVDFVTTGEFDYAVRDIAAGADYADVAGLAYRAPDGSIAAPDRSRRSTISTRSRSSPMSTRAT